MAFPVPHEIKGTPLTIARSIAATRAKTRGERSFLPALNQFSPDLEGEFQANYYATVRGSLRLIAPFMAGVFLVALALCGNHPAPYDVPVNLPQILFWLLIFGLTWVRDFERFWQPVVVLLGTGMAMWVLGSLAAILVGEVMNGNAADIKRINIPQQKFYFVLQFCVLMVSLATLRLQFLWAVLLYAGVLTGAMWAFVMNMEGAPQLGLDARFSLLPGLLVLVVMLLATFVQEQLTRQAFLINHLLEAERNDERRQREQTEGKLHVLGQAIGGIVHDLGNPLSAVQSGASTLDVFLDNDADKDTLKKITAIINRGARMLNYLRLSLIEQTRVLEDRPTQVDLQPVSMRSIVDAGIQFQNSRILSDRTIHVDCPDILICADEMKMVTVFMNLISNSLKYSDGDVWVEWYQSRHQNGQPQLAMAVLDQGREGRGLSWEQALRLFTAFGRLDTHSNIEGIGLGLLSVQKIAQAHGGEAFIEGTWDGTAQAIPFSTAQGEHRSLLRGGFRTAFVLTCPLASRPECVAD